MPKRRLVLRMAPFVIDLTPPIGASLAYGTNQRTDSPIHLRGVVLDDGRTRALLGAAEIIGLYGGVYGEWRRTIARAANVPRRHTLLHCVHQHDSLMPLSRFMQKILKEKGLLREQDEAFQRELLRRLDEGIRVAIRPANWRKVAALATAEYRASGLAANRRLLGTGGKIEAMRFSMTSDPRLQREPVGRIDPLLRTLAFMERGGRLLAALHFYATHPMGAYRRNRAGADIPGVALKHVRRAMRGEGLNVYFTGCGGDITFGKYTFASKEKNLRVLGARLGEAILVNLRGLQERAFEALRFMHVRLTAPLYRERIKKISLRKELMEAQSAEKAKFPARKLELLSGPGALSKPLLSRLDFSPQLHLLSLPAETVIEYQLYAQSLIPEHFLAVAAYGDGTLGYLCTERMFKEGGYEPGRSLTAPSLEPVYKNALAELVTELR